MRESIPVFILLCLLSSFTFGEEYYVQTKETLTVLEINKGDVIHFTLGSGRVIHMELTGTETRIILTTLDTLKKGEEGHGTVYSMTCSLKINGHDMQMVKYVPVQESFYEPYVISGLRIWFDGVRSVSDYFNENHGTCVPGKDARFAFQELDMPVCPQEISNWCPLPEGKVLVRNAYRGDDTWMGTYFGADLHGGMDINMPSNSPLWAPIDFDEQFYFNSVEAGDNNNRWRGIRQWDNGDTWHLQTHHLVELLIPEHQPVKQGQLYAYTAGTWSGYTSHTHFAFRVKQPGRDWIYLDPWIIFWQIQENNAAQSNAIRARFDPLSPVKTGEPVSFSGTGSDRGIRGNNLDFYWDFGDGCISPLPEPFHTYTIPGIYPVTLIVDNGTERDAFTQHIIVDGDRIQQPDFTVSCPDNPSFKSTKSWQTIAYGDIPLFKNTITFAGYRDQKEEFPATRIVISPEHNEWKEVANQPIRFEAIYRHGEGWLEISPDVHDDHIVVTIRPRISVMVTKYGYYDAFLAIHLEHAVNSPRYVRIRVDFDFSRPEEQVIVDDRDKACTCSAYFWLIPEFHYEWSEGYNGTYHINKDNSPGEFIRFTPNLAEGKYRLELKGPAYEQEVLLSRMEGFYLRIYHAAGTDKVWIDPRESLIIGEYEFARGRNGYVEIISDRSEGLIVADAVSFTRIE